MKRFFFCLCLITSGLFAQSSPDRAFKMLKEGNHRFQTGTTLHPDRAAERRLETAEKQEPFAVILGCSDSRVSAEIIFDQGIGDLFAVRVAGNIVGPIELESIEYGVLNLHAPLIVVMGHQNCGAVQAVLAGNTNNIEAIAKLIIPAVKKAEDLSGNKLENAIKANAKMTADQLRQYPPFSKLIEEKKLTVKTAYYNFITGVVEILN